LGLDSFENILGFSYDLILHKYAETYWRVILENDSNWSNLYTNTYFQIEDSVESIGEYLPIWNYDPQFGKLLAMIMT
jgi:hypothetical protein